MARNLETYQLIERSIIKKYRKQIWNKFTYAVKKYLLILKDDKIAVCISGGKDSMLMAKLLQELQKHSDVPFELEFLVMDPGYNEINRKKIESNAELLHIPITVYETDIFDVANSVTESPCYLCARMRRGHLYSKAKELGCNKIALGHHFSDVIETTVMGMFYGAQIQAMLPKLHSTNFESDIFDSVYTVEKSPCYLCARMRRGNLYAFARELGCNKIALGHHYDDVIETILMGMLYGAQIQSMMPKLHSTNFEGMELIRPLYYIRG